MILDPGRSKEVLATGLHPYLESSLLIADPGFADLIAHCVGTEFLAALGVVGVVGIHDVDSSISASLAALSARRMGFGHVIILCSRLLLDSEASIARVLEAISLPGSGADEYQKVIVATNISEAAHVDADPVAYAGGYRGVHGRLVALSEKAPGVSIEAVLHVDMPCMVFGKNTFAFPSRSGASFLDFDRDSSGGAKTNDDLECELQGKIAVNAHLLSSVSRMMDVQPEAFCVGPLSERVGNLLAYVPAHDSTRNARAAFCIIDRALDTSTPSEHSGYFLQQMLCEEGGDEDADRVDGLQPSMFHPGDASTSSGYVEFLTSRTQREALLFTRKWLKEAIRQASLKFSGRLKPGAVSAEDIEALCGVLRDDPAARARYSSLLQISDIACRCLREGAIWDERAKAEQVARLSAEDGPDGLTGLILDELDAAKRGMMSVCDVVRHLMMGSYWMKMADVGAGSSTAPLSSDREGHGVYEAEMAHLYTTSTTILSESQRMVIAEALAAACEVCRDEEEMPWCPSDATERDLILEASRNAVETICSLPAHPSVSKMVEDVLHKRPIPTMKHVGTSIAGLLKSGLGRIGLQHHSPGEYDIIVIFILGGVSATEMAGIRATVDRCCSSAHVVIGGSSVFSEPSTVLRSVFE